MKSKFASATSLRRNLIQSQNIAKRTSSHFLRAFEAPKIYAIAPLDTAQEQFLKLVVNIICFQI